jgi:hypothetical protein
MAEAQQAQSQQQIQQQRYQQFLQLMPLTLHLAGLPASESGRHFNEDQMELRARTIKLAYKHARRVAKECIAE